MNSSSDERIRTMTFASVYPHYVTKVEKKGRTTDELHQVIRWLTGYTDHALQEYIKEKATFEQFFGPPTTNQAEVIGPSDPPLPTVVISESGNVAV